MRRWTIIRWAGFWLGGLIAGEFFPRIFLSLLWICVFLFFAAAVSLFNRKKLLLPHLPLLALFFFTAWLYHNYHYLNYREIFDQISKQKQISCSGMILSHEESGTNRRGEKILLLTDSGAVLPGTNKKLKLLIYASKINSGICAGEFIRIEGKVRQPSGPANPGQFDYPDYLRKKCIHGVVFANTTRKIDRPRFNLYSLWLICGETIRNRLMSSGYKALGREQAAYLHSILYGYEALLPESALKSYQDSGLMHLLVVSGLHVGFIIMFFTSLLQLFRCNERITNLLLCFVLAVYLSVVGANPPVLRSAVMAFFSLWGWKDKTGSTGKYYLIITAFFLTIFNPFLLTEVSFILSAAAISGIFIFTPGFAAYFSKLPFGIGKLCSVSLAAQLGILPFCAYFFGQVAWIGILLNIIAIPLSMLLVMAGLAGECLGTILFPLGKPLLLSANLMTQGLNWLAYLGGRWDWGRFVFPVYNKICFIYLLIFLASFSAWFSRNRLTLRRLLPTPVFLSILFAMMGTVFWAQWLDASHRELKVSFLSVGQASAAVIETPHGQTFVLDAGKQGYEVKNYLAYKAKRKFDGLILSHEHRDHAGGLPAILSKYPANWAWVENYSIRCELWAKYRIQALRPYESSWNPEPGLEITAYAANIASDNPNESSLVFTLRYKKISFLFPGDIEAEACSQLVHKLPECTVMLAPHHGAWHPGFENLFKKIRPKYAIISVGENTYGHPASRTIAALNRIKARIFRTDQSGCVTIYTDGSRLKVREFFTERKGFHE